MANILHIKKIANFFLFNNFLNNRRFFDNRNN